MEGAEINVKVSEHFVLVDVSLGGNGLITPEELEELVNTAEKTVGTKYFGKGVVISGRMPVWAHSALAHAFHPAQWVAHFDPRLGGGVVVQSHSPDVRVGQVIPVQL